MVDIAILVLTILLAVQGTVSIVLQALALKSAASAPERKDTPMTDSRGAKNKPKG